jgi:hypothetical protein
LINPRRVIAQTELNVVESKQDYLEKLSRAISRLHNCGAVHRETVPVHEIFEGQSVWKGEVEVFDLASHPKATRCYGWSCRDDVNDETERYVTVLELPPVTSPLTAVRASIMAAKKPRE